MKKIILAAMLALPTLAFAHGSKIEMTEEGISGALKKFTAEEKVDAFNGVKGWLVGDKIMVRVYQTTNTTGILYTCTMMEMGPGKDDMIECKK